MSLRAKLLGLFAALALVPLVALGVFDYVRSKGTVRRLIADQTSIIADRAAKLVGDRFEIVDGDLRLIAGSAETIRLYSALAGGDTASIARATDSARVYLADAWRVLGAAYEWVELRDASGHLLLRSGVPPTQNENPSPRSFDAPIIPTSAPVHVGGAIVGSVTGAVKVDALVTPTAIEARFGRGGYTLITRDDGSPVYEAIRSRPAHAGPGSARAGGVAYKEGDTLRVATIARVRGVPLAVISAGAVQEFSPSFAQIGVTNLAIACSITFVLAVAFVVVTRRMTQPLETLTAAATEVGRGNFSPTLPRVGSDEVGRLTDAFAAMSRHIDRMMAELETSRHMAAVGSFAQQISHEIRNPLTSIKLNLQSLDRDVRSGTIAPDSHRTLEICLEEIQRLDRVVRGVLKLGRSRVDRLGTLSLTDLVSRAIEIVTPQLSGQGITVKCALPSDPLPIRGDEEQLVGVFLNLLLNAADAMPHGGTLAITIDATAGNGVGPSARVTVSDSGPGIPATEKHRIFDPFFTTKRDGSGLGLAIALRDAEQHGGHLTLVDNPPGVAGASFVVELPLVRGRDA